MVHFSTNSKRDAVLFVALGHFLIAKMPLLPFLCYQTCMTTICRKSELLLLTFTWFINTIEKLLHSLKFVPEKLKWRLSESASCCYVTLNRQGRLDVLVSTPKGHNQGHPTCWPTNGKNVIRDLRVSGHLLCKFTRTLSGGPAAILTNKAKTTPHHTHHLFCPKL